MQDVYATVTEKMIKKLESGTVPWRKKWSEDGFQLPQNYKSKKDYRGINTLILMSSDFDTPHWLTFNQTKDLGGSVIKGEKGTGIVFFKWFEDKNDEKKRRCVVKQYKVFNLRQTTLETPPTEKDAEKTPLEKNSNCESIVNGMPNPPKIHHGSKGAFYQPSIDKISMPIMDRFTGSDEYYSTLFHELIHSTGHVSRLNRAGITEGNEFGNDGYSQEELIAELGAVFLSAFAKIETTFENSAGYLAHWIKRLKEDKTIIVKSASAAQKAADFVTCKKFD